MDKNRVKGMVRSMGQWRGMVPDYLMGGSAAQIEYALIDAKHDIEVLWGAVSEADEQGRKDGMRSGEADQ